MDIWFFVQVAAAVVFGNAASFAFFMAAMKASKLEKKGVSDDNFPAWVYAGLMAAPLLLSWGAWLAR